MTMRKCKLAILAIAVLLQVHTGAGYLFAPKPSEPEAHSHQADYHPPGNTARLGNAGTRMVGRTALPPAGGVLTGNQKIERVEHDNFQDPKTGKQNAD